MTNKRLESHEEIMKEVGVLVDRAMLQIVNAMRHIELNVAGHEAIRRVDQLTRALEYLCDVEEYNKKIEGKLRGMIRSNRQLKQRIKELQETTNPNLEGFDELFGSFLDNVNEELGITEEVFYDSLRPTKTVQDIRGVQQEE